MKGPTGSRFGRRDGPAIPAPWLPERMEPRSLLSTPPLPPLADLEDSAHTAVRIETSLGDIDLELFDDAAPVHVTNFLTRIRRGDIDPSFFDSLAPGRALQGGGYKLDSQAGLFQVPDPGPLAHEAGPSNSARTLAMAATGAGSSAVRFSINLADNPDLDPLSTVFGRVIGEASWAVVQQIAALNTADLDIALTGSEGTAFDSVPVTDGQTPVTIVSLEITKAGGRGEFYTHSLSYPEGFSGSTVDEFVPIANPTDEAVAYQVILRFERDPSSPFSRRDAVIGAGVIGPRSRGGTDVWHGHTDFPGPPDGLITPGRPYAIEVRSTGPVAATLSHYDFGVATGESFTGAPATAWAVPGGVKGDAFDFLVWYNPTGADATVSVTLVPEGAAPLEPIVISTSAYRRAGLNLSLTDVLPAGRFAARITSDQPIVVALSHYRPGSAPEGFSSLGASGDPAEHGAVPGAAFGDTIEHGTLTMSFLNSAGPILGPAGRYALFALDPVTAEIGGNGVEVNGHVGFASGNQMELSGGAIITGRLDASPGADIRITGGSEVIGGVFPADLGPAVDAIASAASQFAALPPTLSLPSIDNNTGTLTGNGGLNVFDVAGDCHLFGNSTLTFAGSASDVFVINLHGTVSISGGILVDLEGVSASHIIFNVLGAGADIKISGGADALGTLLAPGRNVDIGGGALLTGAVIAGGDEIIMSGGAVIEFAGFNPDDSDGDGSAAIDLTLRFEDPGIADVTLPAAITLGPGHSGSVRLDPSLFDVAPYLGKRFTLTYSSTHPVFAGMFQSDEFDGVSTDVAVAAATNTTFGEGFMDPARAGTEVFETVAVYNPYTDRDAAIDLVIRYTDGFELVISRTVAAGRTAFINLHTLDEILQQGLENHRYYYSIEVAADNAVVAQLTHLDTNLGREGNAAGGFSTMGIESGTLTMLDSI